MMNSKHLLMLTPVVILALLYILLITHQQNHLTQEDLNLTRAISELKQKEIEIKKLSHYQHQLDALEKEWLILKENGLQPSQINTTFSHIESLAKQANVTLANIIVDEFITITLESDYVALLNFIEILITYPYFLLTDLQIKRDSGIIVTTVKLHILLANHHV
jgi:signal transduction histidine kinase